MFTKSKSLKFFTFDEEKKPSINKQKQINKVEIPKIIHFIWAGGLKLLPFDSIDTIIEWGIKHPTWKIYLWVDEGTYKVGDIVKDYQDLFKNRVEDNDSLLGSTFSEIKIHEESSNPKTESESKSALESETTTALVIEIKDIRKNHLIDININYEITRLTPNYGASSDLLRYKILMQYGGAYFDTDVRPGKNNLDSVDLFLDQHVLYVEHHTQTQALTTEQLSKFDIEHIGNDSFISTKHNPFMKKMDEYTKANYAHVKEDYHFYVLRAHGNIRDNTIRFTGPHAVRQVIRSYKYAKQEEDDIIIKDLCWLKRLRTLELELARPIKNTHYWLDKKLNNLSNNEIIHIVEKTIEFEIEHFGVLRVDDHMSNLIEGYNKPLSSDEAFIMIKEILEKLNVTNSTKLKLVQISGQYPETIQYVLNIQSFKSLFNIDEEHFKTAFYLQIQLKNVDDINEEFINKMGKDNILQVLEEVNNHYELILNYDNKGYQQRLRDFLPDSEYQNLTNLFIITQRLKRYKKQIYDCFQRFELLVNIKDYFRQPNAALIIKGCGEKILECYQALVVAQNRKEVTRLSEIQEKIRFLSNAYSITMNSNPQRLKL